MGKGKLTFVAQHHLTSGLQQSVDFTIRGQISPKVKTWEKAS